jgi:hypothetical protein
MAIFTYSRPTDAVKKVDGAYLPGQLVAVSPVDVIVPAVVGATALENGQVVKKAVVNGVLTVVPIASGDSATDVFGIVLSDVRGQRVASENIIHTYQPGQTVSIIRQGFVAVPLQQGSVVADASVYVRVTANSDTALPIGGIETAADSAKCVAISATFTGATGYPLSKEVATTETDDGVVYITSKTAVIKLTLGL